ncbi:hypothetical protein Tco_0427872 [Tanacetum coccineum]
MGDEKPICTLGDYSKPSQEGYRNTIELPIGNNVVPIVISCNPLQHSRTKHIIICYHFIKEQVDRGIIELYFVKTEYQLADMFTKALSQDRFEYFVRRLGMRCLTPVELEVLEKETT